jgi:hypothetical protein
MRGKGEFKMAVDNPENNSNQKPLDVVVSEIVSSFLAVHRNGHGHVLIVVKRWDKKRCQVVISRAFSKAALIAEVGGADNNREGIL